ncbi:MAG: hypothetical protein PHI31_02225 [Desulfuromonadaceae bacterium]|nr:hypothetical protein [Desulfuromonadaceae bacterium]
MENPTNCKATIDPAKHVNYAYGMVLGVDDFTQEFAYLSGRDQWMMRDVLGYGTVNGLKVTIDPGNVVHVTSGTAVNQQGQMIHINRDQCADLNIWLKDEKNKKELEKRLGSPPASDVTLYVVLRYRECLTDERPVPGEPCRDEKDLMAPSRVTDDFRLELSFDAPRQCEEQAVRAFIKGLGSYVVISDASGCITTLDELGTFAKWVQSFNHDDLPLQFCPPDFGTGSPPTSLLIHPDVACAYLRAAFRVWVTELRRKVRPNFLADWCGCSGKPGIEGKTDPEERVLLAELQVTVDSGKISGESRVYEENRPYLLTLRMIQEQMLCGHQHPGSDVTGDKGPDGNPGPDGNKGPDGNPGPDGNKGPDGNPGPDGNKGPDGNPGPDGNKGPDGNPGPDGSKGPDGNPGPDGNKGPDGNPGPDGNKGPDGNPGPDGNKGPDGNPGPDGNKGPDGNPGPDGNKGPDGNPGPDGNKGPDGNPGPDGNKGPDGSQGPVGNKGPAGDPFIVAAGCFDHFGKESNLFPYFSYNKLQVTQLSDPRLYHLTFAEYKPLRQFVVKGNALTSVDSKIPAVFEVVLPVDAALRKVLKANAIKDGTGIVIKVALVNGEPNQQGFMVEISAFGEFSG